MKNLINGVVLGTVIGTSTLFATQLISLGVTPAHVKYDKKVAIKITDSYGNPFTRGNIHMDPTSKMSMYAMDVSNNGKYVLKVRHNKKCEEKIVYNETIVLSAKKPTDTRENNAISIPVKFDCRDKVSPYHFETEHPYKNNTNVTKVLPPLCPAGAMCIKAVQFANITGKTEKNYDKITISQNGTVLGTFSGEINEKIPLDSYASTKITFRSDSSVTDKGVVVKLGM